MIWTIYADDQIIYDPRLDDYRIPDARLDLEASKAGSFVFTLFPDHPAAGSISRLASTVTVKRDGVPLFVGRVLDEHIGWQNQITYTCEGCLSYLVDSIQRPFAFPAFVGDAATPAAYLAFLLARHNAQVSASRQLKLGTVTVTDPNEYISRSDTEYSTTLKLVQEGLLDTLGGYLMPRYEADGIYLDYLVDFDTLSNQPVQFALNLLDLKTDRSGADIATAVLPLGAKPEDGDERLTISTASDETTDDICKSGDIVYSKAAEAAYGGRILKMMTWDNVTQASNLVQHGKIALASAISHIDTVEISAADLSAAGYDCNGFSIGTYVAAKSKPHAQAHGLQSSYAVLKLSMDLLNPSANKLTVGATTSGFADAVRKSQATAIKTVESNITASQNTAIHELEQRTNSSIQQTSDNIMLSVADQYYAKGETDQMVSNVSSQITQTADEVNIRFDNFQQAASDVQSGNDAKFDDISKYIRFSAAGIELGESTSDYKILITPTKMSFAASGVEVAYVSNNKLYISNQAVTTSANLVGLKISKRSSGKIAIKYSQEVV